MPISCLRAELSVRLFEFWFGSCHLDFLLPVRSDSIPNWSIGFGSPYFAENFPAVYHFLQCYTETTTSDYEGDDLAGNHPHLLNSRHNWLPFPSWILMDEKSSTGKNWRSGNDKSSTPESFGPSKSSQWQFRRWVSRINLTVSAILVFSFMIITEMLLTSVRHKTVIFHRKRVCYNYETLSVHNQSRDILDLSVPIDKRCYYSDGTDFQTTYRRLYIHVIELDAIEVFCGGSADLMTRRCLSFNLLCTWRHSRALTRARNALVIHGISRTVSG